MSVKNYKASISCPIENGSKTTVTKYDLKLKNTMREDCRLPCSRNDLL